MATQLDGFFSGGERLLALAEVVEDAGEVAEGHCQIGQEGVGPLLGELAIELDGFFSGGERLLALAEVAEDVGEVAERRCQIGQKSVGLFLGQGALQSNSLSGHGDSRFVISHLCVSDAKRSCSASAFRVGYDRVACLC